MTGPGTTLIVIPAFNEVATIAPVVASVRAFGYDVLVVDDGSTDDTAAEASRAGATVVSHRVNRGYDAALATGVSQAALRADVVVTLDADAQHDPAAIAALVDPISRGDADGCVGTRPHFARLAERLFARHGHRRHGIDDPLCGMKALRAPLIVSHAQALAEPSIGTGLVMACQRAGARIVSVPVPVRPRVGRSRFGAGLRAEWRIAAALLRCVSADLGFPVPARRADPRATVPPAASGLAGEGAG